MEIEKGLYGLVLSGGESKRMGKDKSKLSYFGISQREWCYGLLGKFCEKVFISVKTYEEDETLPQVEDRFSFRSPLNGILSAMEASPGKAWLAVSCDMPFLNEEAVGFLLNQRDDSSLVTCFLDSDDKYPEPMVAVWEPECLPLLRVFSKESVRPRKFISENSSNMVLAPEKRWLTNVNTDEEYRKVLSQLSQP